MVLIISACFNSIMNCKVSLRIFKIAIQIKCIIIITAGKKSKMSDLHVARLKPENVDYSGFCITLILICQSLYCWQDPLGRHGNGNPMVWLHERRSAVWPASSCGGAGWTLSDGPDAGGARSLVAQPEFWGSSRADAIAETRPLTAHCEGAGPGGAHNRQRRRAGKASERITRSQILLDASVARTQRSALNMNDNNQV